MEERGCGGVSRRWRVSGERRWPLGGPAAWGRGVGGEASPA
jgi:hypothetical protein